MENRTIDNTKAGPFTRTAYNGLLLSGGGQMYGKFVNYFYSKLAIRETVESIPAVLY